MSWTGFNWDGIEYPRFLADINGDGRPDIVGYGLNGVWTAKNDGQGGFLPPQLAVSDLCYNTAWRVARHPRFVATLTGPKFSHPVIPIHFGPFHPPMPGLGVIAGDLIGFGDAGVWTALNKGDGTFNAPKFVLAAFGYNAGSWRVERHPRFVADITGDGRADIVGFGDDGVWIARNNGDGSFATPQFVLNNLGYNQGWRVDQHPRFLADLTGDGRPDIIGFGNDGVWVARNNGDGSFAPAQFVLQNFGFNQAWRVDQHPRWLADLTGDGRPDIIGFGNDGVWIARNNGDGSFAPAQFVLQNLGFNQGWHVDRHPRFVADLNGDGRADIVAFGDDGVWIARNNGDGSFAPAQFVLNNLGYNQGWRVDQHPRLLADLNGDGRIDIVGFGDDGVWTARNNGDGSFAPAQFVLADLGAHSSTAGIQHVFVLMLENRSFDHMLGFSGITGADAVTGQPRTIDGLNGSESNSYKGSAFQVQKGADNRMPADPGHEFHDVLLQLVGSNQYQSGQPYPRAQINNSGFVASYANADDVGSNVGEVMKCFTPEQLPVLNQLAKEFVVCDRWFCSLPGPTWPNRMFAHAGSSGYLDDSPTSTDILEWETLPDNGFTFGNGTIFDRLHDANLEYRIYAGDHFPMVSGLHGVSILSVKEFSEEFASDLKKDDFKSVRYVHLEPSYDALDSYEDGTSQHPLADVTRGEALIKATYEAIRNSPIWNDSLLIITWDEHGGFYDHVPPPAAVPPNDSRPDDDDRGKNGFLFDQLGPRVPALIISPRIPKNLVDHRVYDHSSIPATIERLFGLKALTNRDAVANAATTLLSLSTPRTDTPATVGTSAAHAIAHLMPPVLAAAQPEAHIDQQHVSAFLSSAVAMDLKISPPTERTAIMNRVKNIHTHAEAAAYMQDVQQRFTAYRKALRANTATGGA
jgi:phospholipase C